MCVGGGGGGGGGKEGVRWNLKLAKIMVICLFVWLPWQQKAPHRLKMGKWLNYIFSITGEVMLSIFGSYDHLMFVYTVFVFYDQWPFCLVAMATLNLKQRNF